MAAALKTPGSKLFAGTGHLRLMPMAGAAGQLTPVIREPVALSVASVTAAVASLPRELPLIAVRAVPVPRELFAALAIFAVRPEPAVGAATASTLPMNAWLTAASARTVGPGRFARAGHGKYLYMAGVVIYMDANRDPASN